MSKLGEEMAEEPLVDDLTNSAVETDRELEFATPGTASVTASKPNGWRCLRQELVTGLPLFIADCVAVCGSVLLAAALVDWILPGSHYQILSLARQLAAMIGLTFLVFASFGLYPGTGINPIVEFRSCVTAVVLVFGSVLMANILFGRLIPYEAWLFGCGFLFAIITVPLLRTFVRSLCSRFRWWGQPVLVIGNGESAISTLQALKKHSSTGLRAIGIVGDPHQHWIDQSAHPEAFLGSLDDLRWIAAKHRTYWAVTTMDTVTEESIDSLALHIPHVVVLPGLLGLPSLWNHSHDCAGQPGIRVEERLLLPIPQAIKRASDLLLVIVGSLFLLPMFAIVVILIKAASPGPAFYGHERIGLGGRRFRAWKFRTMVVNADQVLDDYLDKHPELRDEWERDHKLKSDPRIIPFIGAFIRKTSLDELPQLWNVLRGEMSLVGPRPIVTAEIPKYGERYELYLRVRPGITGLWQISGRNNTTYEERVQYDTYYVRNWSPWLDAHILIRTIKVVLFRDGAY